MTKIADQLLGTDPAGVSNLRLGMTLEAAAASHGYKVAYSDDSVAQFKTHKVAGAELYVSAGLEGGMVIRELESFVAFPDDGTAKAKLKALKKELTEALTQRHGAPDKTRQPNCPYWKVGTTEIYLMSWRSRGNDEYDMPPKEELKLGLHASAE